MELRFYMGKKYTVTEIVGNVSVACIHQYALVLPLYFYDLKYFFVRSALTAVTHLAMVGLARLMESVM